MIGPPVLSVFLFVLAFCIVRTIPETAPYADTLDGPGVAKPAAIETHHSLRELRHTATKYPQLLVFLGCKALITLSYMLLESNFAYYTSQRFQLQPKSNGCVYKQS